MKTLAAMLVCALGSTAAAGDAPILGGTADGAGDYPTVVAIRVNNSLCTGTLVTKDWVMTAAHCLDPAVVGGTRASITANTRVILDSININVAGGTTVMAADTVGDPQFDPNTEGAHDLGLIKLATPVTDRPPSRVNLVAAHSPLGTVITLVGYGTTQASSQGGFGIEYSVARTVVACSTVTTSQFSDANVLCYTQTDLKGQCNGDSGGPGIATIGGVAMVVGISSFGDDACTQYGADTRTDAEAAFLLATVPELACTSDADCPTSEVCDHQLCVAQPFTPGGLGEACTAAGDCDSAVCASDSTTMRCSESCTVGATDGCPSGFDCLGAAGGQGACWPSSKGGGCTASGGQASSCWLGVALFGLVRRRRRQR
jgi:secreted trypsin-like serine protease